MSRTILVITGSPREGGNSDLLADAFIKGAKEAGHEVIRWCAAKKAVAGCKACDACKKGDAGCVQQDDFSELSNLFAKADTLALVTPLYWFSYPAQLKAVIDRMYAMDAGNQPCAVTDCMLLCTGATDQLHDFDGIAISYQLMVEYKKWNDLGVLLVPGVSEKGDILKTKALKRAERMGKHLL